MPHDVVVLSEQKVVISYPDPHIRCLGGVSKVNVILTWWGGGGGGGGGSGS